jgi:hypothetical protein
METNTVNIEDDLNSLRSQVDLLLDETKTLHWYDDVPTVNGKKRSVSHLNTDLDNVEVKTFLYRKDKITGADITVTAAQNWMLLNVAGGKAPTEVAAVTATYSGAVVAVLGAGEIDSHMLTAVAGSANVGSPKNLCMVRDSVTLNPLFTSAEKQIYALIQAELGVVDGDVFDDANPGHRVQLSFVIDDGTGDALIACPVADIALKVINYSYVVRKEYLALSEDSFLPTDFTSMTPFVANITKAVGLMTADAAAAVNVTNGVNIDSLLLDYSSKTFKTEVNVWLNGVLLRCGAAAVDGFDVYPGTDQTKGDLKFLFDVKAGDVVTMSFV